MIWNFCIRRPVLTLVIFLSLAIFGVWGALSMPLRENPDVEFPVVSVNVVFPGAEPEVMETEVIEVLEEEINTVEGLKTLSSEAREEVATVTAEFELERDVDIAAQDVRDRVSRARRDLPDAIDEPIIRKLDPDAQAIMWIALTGDERWDDVTLSTYADRQIRPRIENLKGVGRIIIGGERRYAVRIRLDPARLAAHRITVAEVVAAVQANNVDIPSGRVESRAREFLVKTRGQFSGPEPFNEMIVRSGPDGIVRLSDVGLAVDGVENDRQLARFAGETTVGLGVVKQSGANTVSVADDVKARIAAMAENFPAGLAYAVATDDSIYVKESIRDLVFTILMATGLVVLVVLGFLRNFKGTLIVALAIPTSLFGGVAAMDLLGFSVNNLTMLGLILAIGIVIDDSIVVLESTYRHLENGADPVPAARVGTTEVAFPSVANTLSLAAVFIPVAFTSGLIGRYFYEFSLTVAVTVFASTFTALTLTPMLCSRLLRLRKSQGPLARASAKSLRGLDTAYGKLLSGAMNHRAATVLLGVAALVATIFLFRGLSTEFSPAVDRNQFIVSFETPEGATLAQTDAYARKIESILAEIPEIRFQFLALGLSRGGGPGKVNNGIAFVKLTPRQERDRHQELVMQELRGRLAELPEGRAFIFSSGGGPGGSEQPVQLVLQTTNLDELAAEQENVIAWMQARPGLVGVNTDLKMNKPQVRVAVNRDKASEMGISVADISNTLRYLLGEPDISEVERGSKRYEVIPEVQGKGRLVPEMIDSLYIRNARGDLVSLGNLVTIEEGVGPSAIHHFNRIRSATISASNPPGAPLGDELAAITGHVESSLPPGFSHDLTGLSQDFQESFLFLSITLIFSVVFIYLVLAAQFESFLAPLVILVALPLAGFGAAGALLILDMPLGIYAFIGLIMLMGMATKNAILMIDYTNVLRARGMEPDEAAREAARVRFRPVIMTTLSTVLGMLPIALGFGAGGEARAPMGVAVATGLTMTTLLTLVVLPVVYSLVMRARRRRAAKKDAP